MYFTSVSVCIYAILKVKHFFLFYLLFTVLLLIRIFLYLVSHCLFIRQISCHFSLVVKYTGVFWRGSAFGDVCKWCCALFCILVVYSTYQKFGNAREKRREAYVKSRFSPRSEKIGFLTEGVEIFFGVAIMVGYFLNFFQIFISKERAATNGSKSLETRCRSVLKSGYFAAL